jgi:hypothetical protein
MKTNVKRLYFAILLMLVVAGCGQASDNADSNNISNVSGQTASENYCKKLDGGVFQYKYEDKPDSLTFTILFNCKSDSLKALMFGVGEEGEHGVYFFKENLDSVRIDNGFLLFSLVKQTLYRRAFTLDNYNKDFPNEKGGGSNERMLFKGRLAGDSLELSCDGPDGGCYDNTMVFKKK